MRAALVAVFFALRWGCLHAAETDDSHRAPAPSLANTSRGVSSERQATLAEMWQRRILPPEADQWGPEDMALLLRIRNAEAMNAITVLKSRALTLKGFVVTHKAPGASLSHLRLTKEGYERYIFLRSQEALDYFERKGVGAKWGFQLRDLDGHRLFDSAGRLTEAGEALYNRVLGGLEAHWRSTNGEVFGNRPPPKNLPPVRPAEPSPNKEGSEREGEE